VSVSILAQSPAILGASAAPTSGGTSQASNWISEIRMLSPSNGWAWTSGTDGSNWLLRTVDAGRTWRDRTPRKFSFTARGSCFLDSEIAWVFTVDTSTEQVGLLRTTDGGKSWMPLLAPGKDLMGVASCHFADANHGVVTLIDGGLGSAYYNYYETYNGGATWKPVALNARTRDPNPAVPRGTFRLCTLSGDTIAYHPPSKVIIAYADMPDERPSGVLRLSLSTNLGATWRDIRLQLPDRYREGWIRPAFSVFFGDQRGLLPVFIKLSRGNTYGRVLVFYSTADGGNVWTTRLGVVGFKEPRSGVGGSDFDVVSVDDAFVQSGDNLYVTHDGAQTWQVIDPRIHLGQQGAGDGSQLDFVDASCGWWLFRNLAQTGLYSTTDGGATWTKVAYRIIH
jgi:photosystem II stability/assembly factor-like uncharacterized protein